MAPFDDIDGHGHKRLTIPLRVRVQRLERSNAGTVQVLHGHADGRSDDRIDVVSPVGVTDHGVQQTPISGLGLLLLR